LPNVGNLSSDNMGSLSHSIRPIHFETETLYGQKNIVKTGNHRDSSSTNIIFESSHVQHNTPIPEKTGMKKFECMFR